MAKKGRPFRNDDELLARMADSILRDPTLTRTTAFAEQYVWHDGHQSIEAELKRLVKKFGQRADELMLAARQRAAHKKSTYDRATIVIPRIRFPSIAFHESTKALATYNRVRTEIGETLKRFPTSKIIKTGRIAEEIAATHRMALETAKLAEISTTIQQATEIMSSAKFKAIQDLQASMPRIVFKDI